MNSSRSSSSRRRTLRPGLLALALAVGCSSGEARDPRPVVAVSVLPHQWLVDQLAGELVRSVVMIPPGASPASHQPGIEALRALEEAALYVRVGHPNFPFERAWLALLLDGRESLPIIDASSRELARGGDPHVWLVASSMRATAERVAQALSALLPASARQIGSRLASLRRRIDALDAELRATFAPHAGRSFYVMHPALGHFARAYGLEQVAIERGHKPPSVHALAELIRRARADDVRVVFSQPQFDLAPAQAFADALGGRVETLDALAYDWDDNLRRIAAALVGEFAR